MNEKLLAILCCPETGESLHVEEDWLVSQSGKNRYPIRNGIPDFINGNTSVKPLTENRTSEEK